jgi:pimeloyl-ACP methyl ester carboxylesterase
VYINSKDGFKIYYEIEGSGPTIMFQTGAGGDIRMWKDAGYIAGLIGFRKILIDQRGRGKSDRPSTVESHRLENYVSDVLAVLDDAGVESTAFWGYSDGAIVGVDLATSNPERIRAFLGTGSLPYLNLSDLPKPANQEAEIRKIVEAGGVRASLSAFMEREKDRFPDAIHKNVLETDPMMNALDDIAWLDWRGPLDAYPKLSAPTLIIAGELEDSKRQTEKSIALIPKGKLIRLPKMGHLSAFYRSDVVLPYVLPFLHNVLG